ncbi:MAG: SpoIIE family protein phosphatase [candidate division Zixibacteria bacterium]|nr:SpoIIE family protein phosphatase [candidate division Zixibacteria bacterium]
MSNNLEEENRKLKRAVEELSILNEIASAISSTMEVEEITKLILSKCLEKIDVEQGTITLLKESTTDPFKTFVRVEDSPVKGVPYRLGVSLAGWMLKNQKPLLTNDLVNDPRFKGVDREEAKIRSMLCVPLKVKNEMIGLISLFNKKKGAFTPDDQRLLSIIAMQSAQVIESARLYEEEKKLQQMEEDLKTARNIQLSLLPKETPSLPHVDIAGLTLAAKEVGGDYYDFINIDEDRLGIVIADVSGKGMPAALLMANVQATLRAQALANHNPSECIAKSNSLLCKSVDVGKFVTLFYGILNTKEKNFTYTNAGHCYPLIFNSKGEFRQLEKGGLILGMLEDYSYQEEKIVLQPGELLLLYTDGITEAFNQRDEQFEEERLIKVVQENLSRDAKEISKQIVDDVIAFQEDVPQSDDLTLVVMKVQ